MTLLERLSQYCCKGSRWWLRIPRDPIGDKQLVKGVEAGGLVATEPTPPHRASMVRVSVMAHTVSNSMLSFFMAVCDNRQMFRQVPC